jgi:aspartate aminotransferase
LDILKKAAKIELYPPEGAFYIFAGIKGYLSAGEDSMGFAERLLESQKVAVVPGSPFGEATFVRLSFATDEKTLADGCNRIVEFLK